MELKKWEKEACLIIDSYNLEKGDKVHLNFRDNKRCTQVKMEWDAWEFWALAEAFEKLGMYLSTIGVRP